jgi:hypothetical protein
MVREYLECPRVIARNKEQVSFEAPLRVFVDLNQTPTLTPNEQAEETKVLWEMYNTVCKKRLQVVRR